MVYFLMTNDVECFSFERNQYLPEVAKRVLKQGLPRLLVQGGEDGVRRDVPQKARGGIRTDNRPESADNSL